MPADENDLDKTVAASPDDELLAADGAPVAQTGADRAPAAPYVRQRPAHRSVEPIDDLADDTQLESIAHDSDFTTRGGAFQGRAYRRSRVEGQQLRRDLHYGQYLEIPKGRRDIFASRERKTRVKTFFALVAVIIVIAIAVFVVWEYMQANWGATG